MLYSGQEVFYEERFGAGMVFRPLDGLEGPFS